VPIGSSEAIGSGPEAKVNIFFQTITIGYRWSFKIPLQLEPFWMTPRIKLIPNFSLRAWVNGGLEER
jgi:hypothetical protein